MKSHYTEGFYGNILKENQKCFYWVDAHLKFAKSGLLSILTKKKEKVTR